ncbi:MAG: hypothetical protein ACREM1_04120 [Longimicrobiales bacterium]
MSDEAHQPARGAADVRLEGIHLQSAEFERVGPKKAVAEEVRGKLDLTLARPSEDALAVQLALHAETPDSFRAAIAYRATFSRSAEEPLVDPEQFWRNVAGMVAPNVMFPFLRATFRTLSSEAGLGEHLIMGLINPARIFKLDEIEIPPPSAEGEHQSPEQQSPA